MGTHPIFESDFDCLTENSSILFIKIVKFDDFSKKADDLFKKPFNAGKTNVDIKAAGFVLKNSSKDGAMSSNVEMKINDALMGLANDFKLPCTKKYDGKAITLEMAQTFGQAKLGLDTTFTPATSALGNVLKVDFDSNGVTAGIKASIDAPQNADFHATVGFKNQVLGVKGKLNNIAAPAFVWAPKPCLVVHTDLTKYDMSYHMSGESHQLALKYGWMMGSDHSNFAVAAKKTLANGADFHIKSDLSGITDIAHVSNISVGEFNNVKCTLGAQVNLLAWGKSAPVFGAGFEFAL